MESYANYRYRLYQFRNEFGGACRVSNQGFYQSGMRNRVKLPDKSGALYDVLTSELIYYQEIEEEKIPNEYTVILNTIDKERIMIKEDAKGIRHNQGEEIKRNINKDYVEKQIAAPPTWYAAEIFLYILEIN